MSPGTFVKLKFISPKLETNNKPPSPPKKQNKQTNILLKGRLQAKRMILVKIFANASSNHCRWEPWILWAWIIWIWFGWQKHEISSSWVVANKKVWAILLPHSWTSELKRPCQKKRGEKSGSLHQKVSSILVKIFHDNQRSCVKNKIIPVIILSTYHWSLFHISADHQHP